MAGVQVGYHWRSDGFPGIGIDRRTELPDFWHVGMAADNPGKISFMRSRRSLFLSRIDLFIFSEEIRQHRLDVGLGVCTTVGARFDRMG